MDAPENMQDFPEVLDIARAVEQVAPPANDVPKYLRKQVYEYKNPFLGRGAIGVVLKVIHPFIGTAVYKEPRVRVDQKTFEKHWKREAENIFSLNHHPHIVGLYGYVYNDFQEETPLGLLMEYMEGGSLHDYIQEKAIQGNKVPCEMRKNSWSIEIALGMNFVHSRNIGHRDLRPHNVLLTRHLVAKIADFGLSRTFPPNANMDLTRGIGNATYSAPELYIEDEGGIYDFSADVWSYGMVLYFIHYCSKPFPESFEKKSALIRYELLTGKSGQTPERPKLEKKKIDEVIEKCWKTVPSERCTMSGVVNTFLSPQGVLEFPSYAI